MSEKTEVFEFFKAMEEMSQSREAYRIASDMVYMLQETEAAAIEGFTVDDAYLLASKLNDAMTGWFTAPISRGEYVCAVCDLLENGITSFNNSHFDNLDSASTLKVLLEADEVVFGTLVESTAVQNCYRYLPDDYCVSGEEYSKVQQTIETLTGNVDMILAQAEAAAKEANQGKEIAEHDYSKE